MGAGHAAQFAHEHDIHRVRWANSATTSENFFIRNTEGFQYVATDGSLIATADPRRNYKGLMLTRRAR